MSIVECSFSFNDQSVSLYLFIVLLSLLLISWLKSSPALSDITTPKKHTLTQFQHIKRITYHTYFDLFLLLHTHWSLCVWDRKKRCAENRAKMMIACQTLLKLKKKLIKARPISQYIFSIIIHERKCCSKAWIWILNRYFFEFGSD